MARFTEATLDEGLRWVDVACLAVLAGIESNVSLLRGDPAHGVGSERDEHVKVGVLVGSLIPDLIATVTLNPLDRTYPSVVRLSPLMRTPTAPQTLTRLPLRTERDWHSGTGLPG